MKRRYGIVVTMLVVLLLTVSVFAQDDDSGPAYDTITEETVTGNLDQRNRKSV